MKKEKIGVRFSIRDPPAKPAKQQKQVALEKSLSLNGRGSGVITLILNSRCPDHALHISRLRNVTNSGN